MKHRNKLIENSIITRIPPQSERFLGCYYYTVRVGWNKHILFVWNFGWDPLPDHIYIHDILDNPSQRQISADKLLLPAIRKFAKHIRKVLPNSKGLYVYQWRYRRNPEVFESLGFTPDLQEYPDMSVHVMDFR